MVIGLRAGIAGDVLALLALSLRFVALSAEQHRDARVAAQLCMPGVVVWVSLAEHIRIGDFSLLARKRQIHGGSPYQASCRGIGFEGCVGRAGLGDAHPTS